MDAAIITSCYVIVQRHRLTKLQEGRLAVSQCSIEIVVKTKRDTMQNEVIRCRMKVKDIIERVQCMRGQWAQHIA